MRLIEEVRAHPEKCSDPIEDIRTLEQIDLRTVTEIRRQTKDELADQFGPGRWDKRANGLMKLGVSTFILMLLGNFLYFSMNDVMIQSILHTLLGGIIPHLFVSAVGWLLINTAQLLKYDIFQFLAELANDPEKVKRRAVTKLIRNPRETVQKSWEDL